MREERVGGRRAVRELYFHCLDRILDVKHRRSSGPSGEERSLLDGGL